MPTRAEGLGLTVKSPCTAEWDSMAGNEQVRFCTHCEKSVHNLSAMTRRDALRFARANAAGVCVRFYSDPRGRTLHEPAAKLHSITRRASKMAAGAFGAALALGATALAQTPSGRQEAAAVRLDAREGSSLTGTVLGPNGSVVAGVFVYVYSPKTGEAKTATTNADGVYRVEQLTPGTYTVVFKADGFERENVDKVKLQPGVEQRQDYILALPGTRPAKTEEAGEADEEEKEEAGDSNASCATTAGEESKAAEEEASSNELTELPSAQEGEPRAGRVTMVMGAISVRIPENPLVKAVFNQDKRAAKNLIALGADVNVLDKEADTTALMQAVSHNDAEMVSLLLSAGADVNMKDIGGDTALTRLQSDATVALVRTLTSAGAKVNHKNNYGSTPLINVAEGGAPEVLKELIESGAKVNAKNKSRRTALMEAAQYGFVENVKVLLDAGANVNMKDEDGKTALTLAKELAIVFDEESEEGQKLSAAEKAEKIKEAEESEETKMSKKVVALLVAYGAIEE
jgi:hypothetical protein